MNSYFGIGHVFIRGDKAGIDLTVKAYEWGALVKYIESHTVLK